jgi:O-antigen ligase
VALVAAVAAAATLVVRDPRCRAAAMVAALVLAVVALAIVVGVGDTADAIGRRAAEAAAAGVAGIAALAALTWAFVRWPAAFAVAAIAALPFRVPVTAAGTTANLLLPLYGVIAAGLLAALWRRRASWDDEPDPPLALTLAGRRVGRLEWALAAIVGLYALQSLYSPDREQAVKNICFFYVPFAVLFRLLLDLPWTRRLVAACFRLTVGLSLLFAVVGFAEWATGRLLLTNDKVIAANDLKPYFRVNSLFFDPNIYGRFLALTMILLAATLLWTRRRRDVWPIAAALAVLWGGLVLSLSQSSFGALLLGLAVLAALRWRVWPVAALAGAAAVAGIALLLLAPGVLHIKGDSSKALNRATSGRVELLRGGRDLFADHPVWGVGAGGFAVGYRRREHIRSSRAVLVSHTIPVTVAAEQGVLGLLAYVWLLVAALAMLLRGLPERLRRGPPAAATVARAAVAAAFCALVVHTLIYAAYLEDPLSWTLLAVGAALVLARGEERDADGRDDGRARTGAGAARAPREPVTP